MVRYDRRNSFAQHGRLSFGDRHVAEVASPFVFHAMDCKQILNRSYTGIEMLDHKAVPYKSQTGYPYGKYTRTLQAGESCEFTLLGNAFAVAWVDMPLGGSLKASVDGKNVFEIPTNKPFSLLNKEKLFMENRKGINNLAYGVHKLRLTAVKAPVKVMGVFSYAGCAIQKRR